MIHPHHPLQGPANTTGTPDRNQSYYPSATGFHLQARLKGEPPVMNSSWLNVRKILLVMTAALVLFPAILLLNAYRNTREQLLRDSILQARSEVELRRSSIVARVDDLYKNVAILAHQEELLQALREPSRATLDRANAVLDTHQALLKADVAYLLDARGTTIATSNRNAADSFLGKNYSFRPYFTEAISGKSSAYLALGVTSGRRGIYLAHPAVDGNGGPIRGVAVLKLSIDDLEKSFRAEEEDVILMTDPHGVIFMSSSPALLYKTLWRLEPEEIAALVKSQQFGKQTFAWSGMRRDDPTRVRGPGGEVYEDQQAELAGLPGWRLVHLNRHHVLPMDVMTSLGRLSGILFLGVFPGLGIIVLVLYRTASREIARRLESDELIRDEEARFRTVAQTAGFAIVTADDGGGIVFWNKAAEDAFGYREEEVLGKQVSLLVPNSLRDAHSAGMNRYLATGKSALAGQALELRGLRKDAEEFPLELSLATWHLRGRFYSTAIIQDITLRKQMVDRIQALFEYNRKLFDAAQVGIRLIDLVELAESDRATDPCFRWHERVGARTVIADVNASMTAILGFSREEMLGSSLFDPRFVDDRNAELLLAQTFGRKHGLKSSYEVTLNHKNGGSVPILVNAVPTTVDAETGLVRQSLAVLTDLTELKKAAAERELLVAKLQEAAANIKTLTGLLPICAGCKKIRDDQNRWSPVDVYVSAHTTVEFSHGMCPDCIKAYYPDIDIGPEPGEKT